MEVRHTACMLFLASLFFGGVFVSNLFIGVERTALDADFAKETLNEEQVYGNAIEEIKDETANQSRDQVPFDVDDILTRDYIRNQTEANIDSFYDYIHGRRDSLVLGIDTSPLEDRIAREMEETVRDQRLEDIDPQLARMTANVSAYQTERAVFRQEQYQLIQQSTEENLSQQELEDAYEQRKNTIRQRLLNATESETDEDTAIQEATRDVIRVKVDGLLNDTLSYDEFMTAFNASMERFAAQATARLDDQIPKGVNLTAELDPEQRERVTMARDGLSMFKLFVFLLPLLTLGIAGLMWIVAGSQAGALLGIGHTVAFAGLVSTGAVAGIKRLVVPELRQMLAAEVSSSASETGVGILEQFLDVFMVQSAIILVLGLTILTAGIVLRRRKGEKGPSGEETEHDHGTEDPGQTEEETPAETAGSDDRQTNGHDPDGD